MKKGKFIILDGLDGSGKRTEAKLLVNYLFDRDKKNHVFLTREPYNSEHYEEIRRLLKSGLNPRDNAERLAELFVADRKVHVALIESLISQGINVVSDRYKYSTLAYQQTQGISLQKLIDMHKNILIPDLALIIDVPAEIALERIAKDDGREYKEVFEQKDFQEKLRENFLALPEQLLGEKIIIIDGNKQIEKVFEFVKKEVDKIL